MSPFPDDLEGQLRRAAQRVHAGPKPVAPAPLRPSGRLQRVLGAAPALAAMGVTVALVVAVLVLVGHGRRSVLPVGSGGPPGHGGFPGALQHPTAQVRQELRYIEAATHTANASSGCRGPRQPAGPSFVPTAPSHGLLSVLGILRRAANPTDRLPRVDTPNVSEIYARFIRRARVTDGVTYWIVPAHGTTSGSVPSGRCLAAQRAALRAELLRIPSALRAPTVSLQAQLIAYDEASWRPRDTICFVFRQGNGGGYSCGETAAQITRFTELGGGGDNVAGVVPDGVATVTLHYAASGGQPAMTVSGVVLGNVLAVRVPGAGRGPGRLADRIIWRSAQGRVLRTMGGPADLRAAALFCVHHPRACGPSSAGASSSSSASATTPRSTGP